MLLRYLSQTTVARKLDYLQYIHIGIIHFNFMNNPDQGQLQEPRHLRGLKPCPSPHHCTNKAQIQRCAGSSGLCFLNGSGLPHVCPFYWKWISCALHGSSRGRSGRCRKKRRPITRMPNHLKRKSTYSFISCHVMSCHVGEYPKGSDQK